jgi:hypothetical protein
MILDRNTSTVIGDATTAIGQDCDVNSSAVTRHSFVNGIIDHFPHEVVKSGGAC